MNIGQAAKQSGLPTKTVRYYEDIGLVKPARRANGFRDYGARDVHELRFIARARGLGFSVEECRSAFPVARATPATIAAYDVAWKEKPGLTTRTSYVIARNGRIVMVHDELDWSQHVAKTLAAVKALKK